MSSKLRTRKNGNAYLFNLLLIPVNNTTIEWCDCLLSTFLPSLCSPFGNPRMSLKRFVTGSGSRKLPTSFSLSQITRSTISIRLIGSPSPCVTTWSNSLTCSYVRIRVGATAYIFAGFRIWTLTHIPNCVPLCVRIWRELERLKTNHFYYAHMHCAWVLGSAGMSVLIQEDLP